MADLTGGERRKLERLFAMSSGYVLNFSDRTFAEFFDEYRIQIDDHQYRQGGTSKANRMRAFWNLEASVTVGKVLSGMIDYGIEERCLIADEALIEDGRKIAHRLVATLPVGEMDALTAIAEERDFEVLASHVRDAIEKDVPEAGLDRLHTFTSKFVRIVCDAHGIDVNREKPLHSVFGEYIKALRDGGHLESAMTERILKSSISVLEAFSDVRNNRSLAHDNPILNYEESLLIFNHVAASIRFIKSIETRITAKASSKSFIDDEVPF